MIGFILGCVTGGAIGAAVTALFFRETKQINRSRKVDGIWNVRDERRLKPVDPSRPRLRKVIILERKRRWWL